MNRIQSTPFRLFFTPVLLAAAFLLIWYGIFSYQVGTRNLDFVLQHSSSGWFPVVSLWRGNAAYFIDLKPERALGYYKRAISEDAVLVDAWLALARTELSLDHSDKAGEVLGILAPVLARSTTWKWDELLLAYDLDQERIFQQAFNFILEKMPERRQDAIYLALQRWSDYDRISAHVDEGNLAVWLDALIRLQQAGPAFAVWQRLQSDPSIRLDGRTQLWLCNFLIGRERIHEARRVWNAYLGGNAQEITNGGFENDLIGAGFGWRLNQKVTDVVVKRTAITSIEGAYSLQFRFEGKANVNFHHLYQFVPVEPGAHYRLHFARKARGLTTNEGVFLQLVGWHCKGLDVQSPPVTGTEPWKMEELEFTVPDQCHVALLRVLRKESLMFDNKISGEYWLDSVGMSKAEPSPDDQSAPQ